MVEEEADLNARFEELEENVRNQGGILEKIAKKLGLDEPESKPKPPGKAGDPKPEPKPKSFWQELGLVRDDSED